MLTIINFLSPLLIFHSFSSFLLLQGYIEALGKFEGDDFETLYVQIDTPHSLMRVLVAQGLPVEFDLSHKAFVFEDTADPTSIILDYRGNIVVFKVSLLSQFCLFCMNFLACVRFIRLCTSITG